MQKGEENNNVKKNGIVLTNVLLNKKRSIEGEKSKEFHHIEILIMDKKKVDYSPGDSISVIAENSSYEVHKIMNLFQKNEKIFLEKNKYEENMIFNLLKKQLNIVHLSINMMKRYSFLSEMNFIPNDNNRKCSFFSLLKEFPIKKKFN
ncbi:ferredoxin reductase domain-containing protein [Blattabacterium cuenoti]|uniref:hypothetical protein n=1 Tax=Blattabacterium cuenoti TaxID=1653831 RepID=UPI001EEA0A3E|nr:hypothetical protein [Blattabacterium cuenoti]